MTLTLVPYPIGPPLPCSEMQWVATRGNTDVVHAVMSDKVSACKMTTVNRIVDASVVTCRVCMRTVEYQYGQQIYLTDPRPILT